MTKEVTIARFTHNHNKFEILVVPNLAFEYKSGNKLDISSILIADEIYSDSKKGIRTPNEILLNTFKTTDILEISKTILKKGELNLTTEQRRNMIDQKKRQVIEFISTRYIDPKSGLPHPPLRIQQAIIDAKSSIDLNKSFEEQIQKTVEKIRFLLPLKSENISLVITIPTQYSGKSFSILKSLGKLINTSYLHDGSLKAILEISAATKLIVIEKLNTLTKGTVIIEVVK